MGDIFCKNCGRQLQETELFCPDCGAPVSGGSGMTQGEKQGRTGKRRKWALLIAGLAMLLCGAAGILAWLFLSGRTGSGSDAARYEAVTEINTRVDEIIAPYLNGEGTFDYDEAVLTEAAEKVYEYARELENKGEIAGSAYCEEGFSVSFFLEDGSATVYLPSIKEASAGGGDMGVGVFNMIRFPDNTAGYEDPGKIITSGVTGFQSFSHSPDVTIPELKDFFGSLTDNRIRAVFWQSHGGLYTAQNGEKVFAFVLNEKVTEEKEAQYRQDRIASGGHGPAVVTSGNKYALTFFFFQDYMCQVKGGLFFTGACYSMADDGNRMAQVFLDKGFDVYAGVTDTVNQLYSNEVLSETAGNLTRLNEQGCFEEFQAALSKAEESCKLSLGEFVNTVLYPGRFASKQRAAFRLADPNISITITSADQTVDLNQVSVEGLRINGDGSAVSLGGMNYSDMENGAFFLGNLDLGVSYQLDFIYGGDTIKTVVLDDLSSRTFENNIAYDTVDLSLAGPDTGGSGDLSAYADIVRQYEDQYGTLDFWTNQYSAHYTGVFLLNLVDFDGNGVPELVIGYSVPHPEGISYCAWPSLSVWTLQDGSPVCLYEDAYVTQSDIGRHCLYTFVDNTWYLVTGWSGSDIDLQLLSLQNGAFSVGAQLRSEEQMSGAYVEGMKYYWKGAETDGDTFNSVYDQIYSAGSYNGSVYDSSPYTAEDLENDLNAVKSQIGM